MSFESWRTDRVAIGVLGGTLYSVLFVKVSEFAIQGADSSYGAPLSVGTSGFHGFLAVPSSFEIAPFVLDVVLSCVPFLAVAVRFGARALGVSILAAILSYAIPALTSGLTLGRVPIPLLPIPLNAFVAPPLVVWSNAMIWAVATPFALRWFRAHRSAARRTV